MYTLDGAQNTLVRFDTENPTQAQEHKYLFILISSIRRCWIEIISRISQAKRCSVGRNVYSDRSMYKAVYKNLWLDIISYGSGMWSLWKAEVLQLKPLKYGASIVSWTSRVTIEVLQRVDKKSSYTEKLSFFYCFIFFITTTY